MQPIWLSSYPAGVPEHIDPERYASLPAMLADSVTRFPEHRAFGNLGTFLSFTDLDELSRALAAYLRHELGLEKGERVAIMLPNLLQHPVATFAILRAGLIVVNVNPLYTPRELEHQLIDADVSALIVLERFAHVAEQVLESTGLKHVIITRLGDLLGRIKGPTINLLQKYVSKRVPAHGLLNTVAFLDALKVGMKVGNETTLDPVSIAPDDIAFLQYTGGTTGAAKGAMLTHRNIVANVQQIVAWAGSNFRAGEEVIITALPLYHIFALTSNCMTFVMLGGLNYLITDPRNLTSFVKELKRVKFTGMTGVNTLFNALLHADGFRDLDFSHFRQVTGGGMAVQQAVAEHWQAVTGTAIVQAYGLTETSPAVLMNPLTLNEFSASAGLPLPSTQCQIVDEHGAAVPGGEVGELLVKGPQVMQGYWRKPAETAAALSTSGWLRTGDMARMDQTGAFYLVDRKKDLIIVSGFNVYPNEIEEVVALHPGVLEVACIGVPDAHSGETVKIFVVRKDPELTEAALLAHCKESLTGYKQPRIVEFRETLPKSNVGKILRKELRD